MTVELKKGYTIDSYYDKNTRSYITTLRDNEGNQIRDAYYSGNMTDRNADVQFMKEFFYKYTLPSLTGEVVEESLEDKIKETKRKTKKAKLPALSTLSPIMPDGAAGIATFNSGVGLSEEWMSRDELINKIKNLGFRNYKFDKYTDEQLYRIYHERLNAVNKKRQEKRDIEQAILDKANADYELAEREREVSKDPGSFFKDGIEFESEEAAKEYFGESMDKKIYLNDMHEAWDIEEDNNYTSLNESLDKKEKEFKTINEGLKYFERKAFNESAQVYEFEALYESVKDNLDANDIKKLGRFINKADNAEEITTYLKGLLSEDLSNDRKTALSSLYDDIYYNDLSDYNLDIDEESGINPDPYNTNNFTLTFHISGDISNLEDKISNIESKALEKYNIDLINSDFSSIKGPHGSTWDEGYLHLKFRVNDVISEELNTDINRYYKLAEDISNYANKEWNIWDNDIYDVDRFGNNIEIKFYVKGDWKHDHLKFDLALKEFIEKINLTSEYPEVEYFETYEEESDSDNEYESDYYPAIHVLKLEVGSMNESLNEDYVDDWWGQVDESPYDFAYNYDLTVVPIHKERDSTLYRFKGSKEDIERAKADGYFYGAEFESEEEPVEDIESATKELVEKLAEVGFILDESVTPIRDTHNGKHLQVINPNLVFPIEEANGDEDEAFRLFKDDLREVEYVLDTFDDKLGNEGYITFNFGANKDNVITGGIDIRFRRK